MLRICICDDDEKFSRNLRDFLNKKLSQDFEIEIHIYLTPFDLLDTIGLYDILFLDYELPYMNGINVLEEIKNVPIIKIMISNHNNICFNTYQYKLFWFVRKNNLENDLSILIPSLEFELINMQMRQLKILSGNKYLNIDFNRINYIETNSNYLYIFTNYDTFQIRSSFNSIIYQFDNSLFIIPIYGVIINLNYVEFIDFHNSFILLKNGKYFSISRSKKKGVKERYAKYNSRF